MRCQASSGETGETRRPERKRAWSFGVEATGDLRSLYQIGRTALFAGSRLDRAMFGFFESKLAAERVIAASGIPWTTLRATQFFDLTLLTVQAMSKLPVIPVPSGSRFQPIGKASI